MSSRRVRLRTIGERDRLFLYQLMTSPQSGGRVRFGGATPSPERVIAALWESVLAQFIVEGVSSGEPLGLVAITTPNFRDGFAYLSSIGSEAAQRSGLVAEGVLLGFNYAFCTWPFRKVYMEVSEESYRAFGSGLGRFFKEEGRLREHAFWNGRYLDVLILAVYRATWARLAPTMSRRLQAAEPAADRRRPHPLQPPVGPDQPPVVPHAPSIE
jgi:RimJ/RimL family protein N-acetyltransferase